MKNEISRRDLLKATAAIGAGGLLFAPGCGNESLFAIPAYIMNGLGEASYASAMQEYGDDKISTHPTWDPWVKNSKKRIQNATEEYERERKTSKRLEGFTWEVKLLKDDAVNAWCMPGARMAFYEGIMPLCANEDGVGIVMGHEVAHAVYNHGGQRMAQQLTAQLGITALGIAMERLLEPDETILEITMAVFGVGAQVGLLHYSKEHEYEADRMGLMYAAKAGYNPQEAVRFWKDMSKLGSSGTPEFLSTHPSNENRIKELEEAMPEAMQHYEASQNR